MLTIFRHLLFPPRCRVCGALLAWRHTDTPDGFRGMMAGVMCGECLSEVLQPDGHRCSCCGIPLAGETISPPLCGVCMDPGRPLKQVSALYLYQGGPALAVKALKYRNKRALALPMGRLLYGGFQELVGIDLVVPVPLHLSRLKVRGFNQASLLLSVIEGRGTPDVNHRLLKRTRKTESQAGLSREGRLRNVKGAFSVRESEKDHLKGKHVLLVDDVYTTGSTLAACASVLKRGGAASVSALVFARRDEQGFKTVYKDVGDERIGGCGCGPV